MADLSRLGSVLSVPKTTAMSRGSHSVSLPSGGVISDVRQLLDGLRRITGSPPRLWGARMAVSSLVPSSAIVQCIENVVEDEAQKHINEFYRRRAELFPHYEGKYVAFRDGRVLDSDVDKVALARRFYRTYGYVAVCIAKVSETKRVVRAPTPRRKR